MASVYKIWFAKKFIHPLGSDLNAYRLSLHRIRFPNDTLYLITNLEILSAEDKQYVRDFCKTYQIVLIDLPDIKKALEQLDESQFPDKKIQQALFEIAKIEANAEFGNLAAASDIIRVLSPVLKLGAYMDIDVNKKAEGDMTNPFGFALNCKVESTQRDFKFTAFNSNIFYFNEELCLDLTRDIRERLLSKYQKFDKNLIQYLIKLAQNICLSDEEKQAGQPHISPIRAIEIITALSNVLEKNPTILNLREILYYNVCDLTPNETRIIVRVLNQLLGVLNIADTISRFFKKVPDLDYKALELETALPIKIPFKDDADLSWLIQENSLKTEEVLRQAVRVIQNAYLNNKARLQRNRARLNSEPSPQVLQSPKASMKFEPM